MNKKGKKSGKKQSVDKDEQLAADEELQPQEAKAQIVAPPRSDPSPSQPVRWEPGPELTRLLQTVRGALGTILDAADAAAEVLVQRFGRRA